MPKHSDYAQRFNIIVIYLPEEVLTIYNNLRYRPTVNASSHRQQSLR
jgi:hypothetical protein